MTERSSWQGDGAAAVRVAGVALTTSRLPRLSHLGDGGDERPRGRFAAIDIGSNSIHMIVVEPETGGGYRVLGREKEMVGLGRCLGSGAEPAALPSEAVASGLETLAKLTALASLRGAERAVAVATSAVRESPDGVRFLERVRASTGLEVRLLSGEEEGRLIFLAVREALDLSVGRSLVVDVGGGSTEWIPVDGGEPGTVASLPLGSLRLAADLAGDPPSGAELSRLRKRIGRVLAALPTAPRPDRVIATSGTAATVAALAELGAGRERRPSPGALREVRAKEVRQVVAQLRRLRRSEIAALPAVGAARAASILPGAVLLEELLRKGGADRFTYCDRALRDGLVVAVLGQPGPPEESSRRRQVDRLARRVESVYRHSVQSARLAVRLFDLTVSVHGLGAREREWLEYAALLHDIGYSIHYRRHHEHSRYLIANAGLEGFDPAEIEVIALTARYHRGRRPRARDPELAALAPWQKKAVRRLAPVLRLADALDRTHASRVEELYCAIRKRKVRIDVVSPWDVGLELEAARDCKRLFERVFGVEIRLRQGLEAAH